MRGVVRVHGFVVSFDVHAPTEATAVKWQRCVGGTIGFFALERGGDCVKVRGQRRHMIRHLLAVGAFAFGNTSAIIRRTAALMRRVRVLHSFPGAFDFGNPAS